MTNDNDYDRFHVDLSGHSHCHKSLSDGLAVPQSHILKSRVIKQRRVSYSYRTATTATFLSWGISEGAGRIRLTRCKSTDFYRNGKRKSDFFSLWSNTMLIYRDINKEIPYGNGVGVKVIKRRPQTATPWKQSQAAAG